MAIKSIKDLKKGILLKCNRKYYIYYGITDNVTYSDKDDNIEYWYTMFNLQNKKFALYGEGPILKYYTICK